MRTREGLSILFVCMGNICRSPLVEAVARQRSAEAGLALTLASCGTGNWHAGKGADPRMVRAAAAAGYDLAPHRARQVRTSDFVEFDWVLAMDRDNLAYLEETRRGRGVEPTLFLPWASVTEPEEFPDPYFGAEEGFRHAVALAEQGVDGLIARLRRG
ncbi:low molecular weight protein-tyrosine-phosphatase [Dyella terrae]|uniref:low molecular weight protein-tyrosine-phosphatase n=1 Tax=Dyella terrae TaxID=522259 RepID=UPI001EFDC325|nr:low molecular weight protein-tyrosine-phosphatase [Dyella terrae]ULU23529.1 low molecular weight phosphotyrosine protein phosphatase [Dyella terrae]